MSDKCHHRSRPLKKRDIKKNELYDYIVVGGGTAGSALTYKLNQLRPNLKILVLESGQDDQALADTVPALIQPGSTQELYPGTGEVWSRFINGGFFTVLQADTDALHVWNYPLQVKLDAVANSDLPEFTYNLGSTWGGSSAHNYQVWLRPTVWYIDYLRSIGLTDMTFQESVDCFKEIENRSALGPKSDGNVGGPFPKYFDATNANPFQPNPLLADNGFDPALHGTSGNVVLFQQNYIEPNYRSLIGAFETINADAGYDRFGILVNAEQTQYPEIINRNNFTGIFNTVNNVAQQSIYNFIGGLSRISLLPAAPANYTTPNTFTRVHAGVSYLLPASQKANVTVLSNVFVTEVTMDSCRRVTGVKYILGRNVYRSGRNNQTDYAASSLASVATREAACVNSTAALANPKEARCNYEVILSAGFVHTPAILEHSGIGSSEVLGKVGIKAKMELPGVGENLSDHAVIRPSYTGRVNPYFYIPQGLLPAGRNLGNFRFISGVDCEKRPDVLSIPVAANVQGNLYPIWTDRVDGITRFAPPQPFDIQDGYNPVAPSVPAAGKSFSTQLCYPESRGSTHIRSSNPTDVPLTAINPYASAKDINRMIKAFRFTNEIMERSRDTSYVEASLVPPFSNVLSALPANQAFQDYFFPTYSEFTDGFFQFEGAIVSQPTAVTYDLGTFVLGRAKLVQQLKGLYLEMKTGAAAGEKRLILDWNATTNVARVAAKFNNVIVAGDQFGIRRTNPAKIINFWKKNFWTTWHGCGTAKMGLEFDPMAVVDQSYRVYGIKGLRVADNSVYPVVPDVNTQTTAYLAGWRCAKKIDQFLASL